MIKNNLLSDPLRRKSLISGSETYKEDGSSKVPFTKIKDCKNREMTLTFLKILSKNNQNCFNGRSFDN